MTVRALKSHSGHHKIVAGKPLPPALLEKNVADVEAGATNLIKHIQNVVKHGVTPVVAINRFESDHPEEIEAIREIASAAGARCRRSERPRGRRQGWRPAGRAGRSGRQRAEHLPYTYDLDMPLKTKIETIAKEIYGAAARPTSRWPNANCAITRPTASASCPIMAKTHLSLSSDPALKGAPTGLRLPVREVRASVGAGFVYPIAGDMRTMPGLSEHPAAERIDLDENGNIIGLS